MSAPEETEAAKQMRLHSELWHACAGGRVNIPAVSSRVFYFPQGHMEHASENVDLRTCPRIPLDKVLCSVRAVELAADPYTDNVFVRLTLDPCSEGFDSCIPVDSPGAGSEPPEFFMKTLSTTEAMKGSCIQVPLKCAETFFPNSNPVPNRQKINFRDIHGKSWTMTHVNNGKLHTLTSGWRAFFDTKKLLERDTLVFMRAAADDIRIGILRKKPQENAGRGRLKSEDVLEAFRLSAEGRRFNVVYYPRDGGADFCVGESIVRAAERLSYPPGMTVKMDFETDESEIDSFFLWTIESVQIVDPDWWPISPWRCLQVTRNSLDPQLQNMIRVSPWLVELVGDFATPNKKIKLDIIDEYLQQEASNSQSLNINDGSGSGSRLDHGTHSGTEPGLETRHCDVFMGSGNTNHRSLEVSSLGSYLELYNNLASLFGIEFATLFNRVVYEDDTGKVMPVGDEPFSVFVRKVRLVRITDDYYYPDGFSDL